MIFTGKKNKPHQLAAVTATTDRMNEEPASSPLQLFSQPAGHPEHVRAVSKKQMGKEAVTTPACKAIKGSRWGSFSRQRQQTGEIT